MSYKKVLRDLQGTKHLGFHIRPSFFHQLYGYIDDSWSTRGYCLYHGENLIYWSSRKQQVGSKSIIKSKYKALVDGATKVAWFQSLLQKLKMNHVQATVLWRVNMGARSLTSNLVFHARIRHIEINVVRVIQKKLEVKCVSSLE